MAHAKNLSNEIITTITAGNIMPSGKKKIADWEAPIIEMIHGSKVVISYEAGEEPKKKGKK